MTGQPGAPRGSIVRRKLRDHGPLVNGERGFRTGNVSNADRNRGVRRFGPHGPSKAVFYIEGIHDPERVVAKWLETNAASLADISDRALQQRIARNYDDAFAAASKQILSPDHSNGGGDTMEEEPCPYCGEPVKMLPDHIPDDCPDC